MRLTIVCVALAYFLIGAAVVAVEARREDCSRFLQGTMLEYLFGWPLVMIARVAEDVIETLHKILIPKGKR